MRTKQSGSALVIILFIQAIILHLMLLTSADLVAQQKVIHSFKVGLENHKKLLLALEQLEHGQLPSNGMSYKIESFTPNYQRLTVRYDDSYQMQSVIKNGRRISLRVIKD